MTASSTLKRQSFTNPKTFSTVLFNNRERIDREVQQINEDGKRSYLTPEGNSYPSITTVMSWLSASAIAAWRQRVGDEEANKISKQATNRGTSLHELCEKYLNNEEDFGDVPLNVVDIFNYIKPILDDNINNIYCQETRLYSDYIGVAGTVDCIAEFRGIRSVIDFKTARKPKKREYIHSYFMQTAGYAVMFEELTGIAIPQLVIIMVSEEGEQVFIERRDDWASKLVEVVAQYKAIHS
jgi:genome maintenance exonuclease 1